MHSLKLQAIALDRQINFLFENNKLERLSVSERAKMILTPAQMLLQAAGLSIEELRDAERRYRRLGAFDELRVNFRVIARFSAPCSCAILWSAPIG